MKKINLYDYKQEMLENITKVLAGRSQVTFYTSFLYPELR